MKSSKEQRVVRPEVDASNTPRVLVLVRSMNRDSLASTLMSLEKQTFKDFKVVVVNASGKPHRNLAFAELDAELLETDAPLRRAEAANRLLNAALLSKADYGLFLDDDDLVKPNHLEVLVGALDGSDSVAAYSATELQLSQTDTIVLNEPWSRELLLLSNYIPIHSAMFRLSILDHAGIKFDESLEILEDWDFWLQLAQEGEFSHIDNVGAVYRVFLGQSDLSASRDHQRYALNRSMIHQRYLLQASERSLTHTLGVIADTKAGLRHELQHLSEQLRKQLQSGAQQDLELRAARVEIERLNSVVQELKESTSFKITAPLRLIGNQWIAFKKRYFEMRKEARVRRLVSQQSPSVVDVIVPVYRGLEETRACIDSVLVSRDSCRTKINLIVINDFSPEPELTEWLRTHAQMHDYKLLENEANLGFVLTVNRGMRESVHDVVLLNSDTEVVNDWLDRMVSAAYNYRRPVSSVTPFSNNATICSFPDFCADNQLEAGFTLADIDNTFAASNAAQAVEVPTAIGFCMYITRSSLDDVGLFDEEKFGKGYGEENEFCLRSQAAGWTHIHTLDTFVWHKGSVSFGTDVQRERVQQAIKVIDTLYPRYQADVQKFVVQDPARPARVRAQYQLFAKSEKKRGLIVTHDRAGGVQRNIKEIMQQFDSVGWVVLKPGTEGTIWLELGDSEERDRLVFDSLTQQETLKDFLSALGLSFVHWHHLLGLPADVRALIESLALASYFSVHDYYSICPQISLTTADGKYCGEPSLEDCEACVSRRPVLGCESVALWREAHGAFLRKQQRLIAPSRDCAVRLESYFNDVSVDSVPHEEARENVETPPHVSVVGRSLRVAVLGGVSKIKGADILEAVAKLGQQQGVSVEFKLFGHAYRALSSIVQVTGPYHEADLKPMLAEWAPDIVWFPAQCPETYSYTLSTCLQMGLPVAATNLGAFAERLAGRSNSWILPWDTAPSDWLKWFDDYRQGKALTGAVELDSEGPRSSFDEHVYYQELYAQSGSSDSAPERLSDLLNSAGEAIYGTKTESKRQRLVRFLYRIRSSRLLAPIMRRVPTNLQTYIKNRILGYRA